MTESYLCPACGATLEYLAGGDSAGHWLCPTCGLTFVDEDELKAELAKKAAPKK